jgi:DNA ligase-1
MLAKDWVATKDPTGWWMTEKYDGIRALWNGSKLYSRLGKEIKTPEGFTDLFPKDTPLDGELWYRYRYIRFDSFRIDRNHFEEVVNLTRTTNIKKWRYVTYWVFDTPNTEEPYEKRMDILKKTQLPGHIKVIEAIKCTGQQHLDEYFQSIIQNGGEGVMLRQPNSRYISGRSSAMQRVKVSRDIEIVLQIELDILMQHCNRRSVIQFNIALQFYSKFFRFQWTLR